MSKPQGVLKMFMLGMLKTILKTVLKYEKNTITLYGTCWNWAADFVFLLRFCTTYWSETYPVSEVRLKHTSLDEFHEKLFILGGYESQHDITYYLNTKGLCACILKLPQLYLDMTSVLWVIFYGRTNCYQNTGNSVTVNTYIHVYVMKTTVNFNDVHCEWACNKLNVEQSSTPGKS